MQLKNHAALVTGGAKVAVLDLNMSLAESVAKEIGGVAVHCDVSDAASGEAALAGEIVPTAQVATDKGLSKLLRGQWQTGLLP
eukprot:gene40805-55158_t